MIDLIIPITPVAKGRPKFGRGRAYTPRKTVDAEKAIALYAKPHCKRLIEGAVMIGFDFVFTPPASWSRKKREQAMAGLIHKTTKPDVSNMTKLVEDALNGIAYIDDSQIIGYLQCGKRYGPVAQIRLLIMEV